MSKKKAHPEPEPAAPEANASGRNALVLRLPELADGPGTCGEELAKLLRAACAPRVLYCEDEDCMLRQALASENVRE